MKHLANLISVSRIILLLGLFFVYGNRPVFVAVYIFCGVSDVADGYVARKTNTQSKLGARLDSIADLMLFAVITWALIVGLGKAAFIFLPVIGVIAVIRLLNLIIAFYKYRSFAILHTWANKATGLLLFISPLFVVSGFIPALWLPCIVGLISALEEGIIHLVSSELNLDRRSIFLP